MEVGLLGLAMPFSRVEVDGFHEVLEGGFDLAGVLRVEGYPQSLAVVEVPRICRHRQAVGGDGLVDLAGKHRLVAAGVVEGRAARPSGESVDDRVGETGTQRTVLREMTASVVGTAFATISLGEEVMDPRRRGVKLKGSLEGGDGAAAGLGTAKAEVSGGGVGVEGERRLKAGARRGFVATSQLGLA